MLELIFLIKFPLWDEKLWCVLLISIIAFFNRYPVASLVYQRLDEKFPPYRHTVYDKFLKGEAFPTFDDSSNDIINFMHFRASRH